MALHLCFPSEVRKTHSAFLEIKTKPCQISKLQSLGNL